MKSAHEYFTHNPTMNRLHSPVKSSNRNHPKYSKISGSVPMMCTVEYGWRRQSSVPKRQLMCTGRCVPGHFLFDCPLKWRSKSALKINPCEIRKDLHRRLHPFYPLMIYQIVKRYHRNVAVSTLSAENPRNNKMGRVLLWTGLHRGNFERESSKSKSSFSGDGSSPN